MPGLLDPLSTRPRRIADIIAAMIDNPTAADRGVLKPFLAGATQGVGDVLSDMTSPVSIGASLLGMPGLSKVLKTGTKAVNLGGKAARVTRDLGPEFVAPFQQAGYNAKRAKRLGEEAKTVKSMSERGNVGRAIQPTSTDEVLKFRQARERARYAPD